MTRKSVLQDDQIAFLLVTGLCSGMSIITCGFVIFTYVFPIRRTSCVPCLTPHSMGVSFNVRSDRNRQQCLALVSFCAAIFGVIGNGLQEGHLGTAVSQRIVSFFFNWFVQVRFIPALSFDNIIHRSSQAWPCRDRPY